MNGTTYHLIAQQVKSTHKNADLKEICDDEAAADVLWAFKQGDKLTPRQRDNYWRELLRFAKSVREVKQRLGDDAIANVCRRQEAQ